MRLLIVQIFALLGAAAQPAQLATVQKVYLLPMTGGLDQHLAERLTRAGVFIVVVDPKQADAVWSEQVDAGFRNTMEEMYPPPKPPAPKEAAKQGEEPEPQALAPRRSLGRARGNVFLVGVSSRRILWSTYKPLEDITPRGLHRAAGEIVKQLEKDLGRGEGKR